MAVSVNCSVYSVTSHLAYNLDPGACRLVVATSYLYWNAKTKPD